MFYYPAPFFTAVKRIMVQLEERLTQLLCLLHELIQKLQLLGVKICDAYFPSVRLYCDSCVQECKDFLLN